MSKHTTEWLIEHYVCDDQMTLDDLNHNNIDCYKCAFWDSDREGCTCEDRSYNCTIESQELLK